MNKLNRMEDIKNRYSLALAERNFTEPGTENYNTLSEVAKTILKEYQHMKQSKYTLHIRYGFRLYGTKYKMIILSKSERV